MRNTRTLAVLVATFALITTGVATPSAAERRTPEEPSLAGLPQGFTSWRALFDAQRPLDDAADRIDDAATANPTSGFTSVRVDAEIGTLTLRWKDRPSTMESAVITAVERTGVKVVVVPARYSRTDLDAQVDLVVRDVRSATGERVVHATKRPDGSGIEVGVRRDRRINGALGSSLPHLRTASANGAVTVVEAAAQDHPEAATRENDSPSWYGGAVVRNGGGICSSGFGVFWPADGQYYMTTAGHCGWPGSTITDGANQAMGVMTDGNGGYDMRFIRTSGVSGATAGRTYSGPGVFSAGQVSAPVVRASRTHEGDWLCTSGAIRGLRCSIRASGPTRDCRPETVGTYGLGDAGGCWNVQGGISSVGELFFGKGDSGGPVFVPVNGILQPNSAVDARGLISSLPIGWNWQACAAPLPGTGVCSPAVWYTDIVPAIAPWAASGMRVITG